jgi:serine/threonine-protein kinase
MPDNLKPGEVFAGRYRVERELGRGGFGVVYACEHIYTGQKVALKLVLADRQRGTQLEAVVREKFKLEQRVWSQAPSEHIVRVLDAGNLGAGPGDARDEAAGTPYIVMELLLGETLQQRVERLGPLPPEQLVCVMEQIAIGLDEAHACRDADGKPAPIVHRDLKPQNVFLTRRADGSLLAKLLDFGIAKQVVAGAPVTEALLGTGVYIAPEQFKGHPLSAQSDIWSFGLTAYYALTGRDYRRDPDAQGQLPREFESWFSRCLAEEPARRFASAGEAAAQLAIALASAEARGAALPSPWAPPAATADAPPAAPPLAVQTTAEPPASASREEVANAVVAATAVEPRGAPPGVTVRIQAGAVPAPQAPPSTERQPLAPSGAPAVSPTPASALVLDAERPAHPLASEGSLRFRWRPLALAAAALALSVYFIRAERAAEPVPGAGAGSGAPLTHSSGDVRSADMADAFREPPRELDQAELKEPSGQGSPELAEPLPLRPSPPSPRPAAEETPRRTPDVQPAPTPASSRGNSKSASRRASFEEKAPANVDRPRPASGKPLLPPRTRAARDVLETLGNPTLPAR